MLEELQILFAFICYFLKELSVIECLTYAMLVMSTIIGIHELFLDIIKYNKFV